MTASWASHRIDMPIQHGHCAGLGLAMHVLLDLTVPSRSAPSLVPRPPSGVALAVIDDADCEPMQMDRPLRRRPALYLERLYPLQQSWPDRKA